MKYEPIKNSLGKVFNHYAPLRKLFYNLLDLLLLRAWHIKRELRIIRNRIGDKATVLDAGSGFGQYSYFMTRLSKFWVIRGAEINATQVADNNHFFRQIRESGRVRFFQADLTQYKEESFYDLIVCVDVMEHIEDDVKVFQNFHASLKPNGMVLISTPSDKGGSDVHDDDDKSFIDEHVREGYNMSDIKEKLKYAGFSRIEARYSYGKPGSVSWRLSMKYPITLLNISKLFFILLPFYYIITFPFCLIMNYMDLTHYHETGTGLVVKAWK
jgi:SAM-dependent methyltransferase